MSGGWLVAVIGLCAGTVILAAAWIRHRHVVVTVSGSSMEPTYHSGDRVLVRRAALWRVKPGQVVVIRCQYPEDSTTTARAGWMLKRAVAVPGDDVPRDVAALHAVLEQRVPTGHLVVLGDNPLRSTDSRELGYLRADGLLGVVIRDLAVAPR